MKIADFFITNRRIRTSLLIGFTVFIILPALAVGIFSYVQSKHVLERSVFNTLEYLIDAQESAFTNWSINRKNFLVGLADNERIELMEYDTAKRALGNALHMDRNFRTLALVGLDGRIMVEPFTERTDIYIGDRAYFQQAIKGQTSVSEIILSRNTNEPVLVIATPVRQKNTIVGVLLGAVKVDVMTQLVQQNAPGERGESYLVNREGLMINHPKFLLEKTSLNLKINKQPLTYISEGKSGRGIYSNYMDKKVFGIYRYLPGTRLGLVVEKEYHSAMLEYGLQTYFYVVIISGLIVVVFILFGVHYSRKLSNPLERLAAEVNQIAEGNYRSVLSMEANKEVQELSNAINHLSSNILEKTDQLNNLIEQLEKYTDHLNHEKNQLEKISITDELTGLYNRRYINQELERMILLSSSLRKNVSLLMLDLDRFKLVNDNYGHATGDEVLKEFAQILRNCSRDHDLLGRFGGEEFILVVPFVKDSQARDIAERIRQDVENYVFDSGGHKLTVTVSIGIATLTPPPEKSSAEVAELLLRSADDCLYEAKETGRNKVIHVNLNE